MKIDSSRNLIFKSIEYSINKKYITPRELFEDLKLDQMERGYFHRYLVADSHPGVLPNHIFGLQENANDHLDRKYMLLSSAQFQYIDYLEIVEARRHARLALVVSLVAIVVTVVVGVIPFFAKT